MHLLLLQYLWFTETTAYVQLRFKLFIPQHKNLRKPVASEQYVNLTELAPLNSNAVKYNISVILKFQFRIFRA
jgi:hypothetical protein